MSWETFPPTWPMPGWTLAKLGLNLPPAWPKPPNLGPILAPFHPRLGEFYRVCPLLSNCDTGWTQSGRCFSLVLEKFLGVDLLSREGDCQGGIPDCPGAEAQSKTSISANSRADSARFLRFRPKWARCLPGFGQIGASSTEFGPCLRRFVPISARVGPELWAIAAEAGPLQACLRRRSIQLERV